MIENLAEHGVQAADLVPSLMTTHTVANPEYDPEEARRRDEQAAIREPDHPDLDDDDDISVQTLVEPEATPKITSPTQSSSPPVPQTPTSQANFAAANTTSNPTQTTTKVLGDTTAHMPGVTTSLSSADENVTLDIRWTVLCDLFLILIADSVYDARSRVLLEHVAQKLGLGWLDVVRFESRVTEALEIQEDIEKLEQQEIVDGVQKAGKRRRYMMMGLATLGICYAQSNCAGILTLVYFRWWTRYRVVCWPISTGHRRWSRGRFLSNWNHRDWGILGRYRRCSGYNHWRSAHWICYCWAGNGQTYKTSPHVRYPSPA